MRGLAVLLGLATAACATPRMAVPEPPGVEAAVAFDADGEHGQFARGLADPATGRRATIDDPVRIASISKLVVAIGVMRLVEEGTLDLDSDVSKRLGWPLRNPAHAERAISLRMLLSHTAGVRDHDDQYAIPLGGTVRAAMSDPRSWDSAHAPGYFTYANMNFPIVASVMERATGERFDRLMQRLVLAPLMLDACFNWTTCSDAAVARAVVLTQGGKAVRDDLGGKRPDCPVFVRDGDRCDLERVVPGENGALFAPQGGLRISARDLARVGRLLLNRGRLDGVQLLSPHSVETLLRPQWRFDGRNGDTDHGFYCSYGLASQQIGGGGRGCADDGAGDGRIRVGHAGEAYGLRSGLWLDPERGTGVAYFVTGLPADPPRGRSAFRAAEERLFREALDLFRSRR